MAILESILRTGETNTKLKLKVLHLLAFLKLSEKKFQNALELIEEGLTLVESDSEDEIFLLANKMFALFELGNQVEGKNALEQIVGSGNQLPIDTKNCAVTWKWIAQKTFTDQQLFRSLPSV